MKNDVKNYIYANFDPINTLICQSWAQNYRFWKSK